MKTLDIGDFRLTYTEVRPIMFMDLTDGIPFSYIKAPDTMNAYKHFQAMRQETNPQDTSRQELVVENACRRIVERCITEILYTRTRTRIKEFPADILSDRNFVVGIGLTILTDSLQMFKTITTASADQAVLCAKMAAKFGKTPIEILAPSGGYTELDAYMYNRFAYILMKEYSNNDK